MSGVGCRSWNGEAQDPGGVLVSVCSGPRIGAPPRNPWGLPATRHSSRDTRYPPRQRGAFGGPLLSRKKMSNNNQTEPRAAAIKQRMAMPG